MAWLAPRLVRLVPPSARSVLQLAAQALEREPQVLEVVVPEVQVRTQAPLVAEQAPEVRAPVVLEAAVAQPAAVEQEPQAEQVAARAAASAAAAAWPVSAPALVRESESPASALVPELE